VLKEVRFSLYEFFGYVLPGMVFLLAWAVLLWALLLPKEVVPLRQLDVQVVVASLLLAYLLGHAAQAISNLIFRTAGVSEFSCITDGALNALPKSALDTAAVKAARMTGIRREDMKPELLYSICDEALAQQGKIGDREVYQYREGFYRGVAVAAAVFTVSLLARALGPQAVLTVGGQEVPLSRCVLFSLAACTGLCVWLSFQRYKRFVGYRVKRAVLAFLVLEGAGMKEEREGE